MTMCLFISPTTSASTPYLLYVAFSTDYVYCSNLHSCVQKNYQEDYSKLCLSILYHKLEFIVEVPDNQTFDRNWCSFQCLALLAIKPQSFSSASIIVAFERINLALVSTLLFAKFCHRHHRATVSK